MPEGKHAATRPGRVDCIYNRTRGRNIKDFSRAVVPLKYRSKSEQIQISSPRKSAQFHNLAVSTSASNNNRRVSSPGPLIDSKKACFEAYLRNSSNRTTPSTPSKPKLRSQRTDPGSSPPLVVVTQGASSSPAAQTPPPPQYQRSSSVPSAAPEKLLSPPDPHKHLRGTLNYQANKGPKVSVLLATPSSNSPGIRLTTASPPLARQTSGNTDNTSRSGLFRRMDSHDSGYGNSPGKSIDKSDSVDISEIEAEYYKTIPPNRKMSSANFPLYVNKLSELFTTKKNFEAFLKSEFKYVAVASVIEAARGFVITASREDVQFLKVKLPMVIPGGCAVHEMSSDEEINTFYLILKPVPEDITISTVMRCLIDKKFPVKKIKRISNKVTRQKTKVVVVTLESTHKKLLSILETGTIQVGEHTVRAFLLYPNSATSHTANLMTSAETSANNSPMASVDYTLGTLSPLGGSQWSSGVFDSVEGAVESPSRPESRSGVAETNNRPASRAGIAALKEQNRISDSETQVEHKARSGEQTQQSSVNRSTREERETRLLPKTGANRTLNNDGVQSSNTPRSSGVVLASAHESSVYSAIERMLIASKTGLHPVNHKYGMKRPIDRNTAMNVPPKQSSLSDNLETLNSQKNNSRNSERCKSPTSLLSNSTVSVEGSDRSDRTIVPQRWEDTSVQRRMTSSQQSSSHQPIRSQMNANRSNQSHKSGEKPQRGRKRTASSEREVKPTQDFPLSTLRENDMKTQSNRQSQVPPPKPKRTLRPDPPKQTSEPTKGAVLAESILRGAKITDNPSNKVSFKDKARNRPKSVNKSNKVVRNVSVQYEEMPPDFSDFMLDQEDSYFCKLDGLVKLMKERPTSQETEALLMKVREANLARSRYGVTYVEPGRNEDEEKATENLIGEMLKEAEEAKQRMVTGNVSPPDTFCFKDIVKPPDDPAKKKVANTMMKTALEGMIENERQTTQNDSDKRRSTKNGSDRRQSSKNSDKESSGQNNLVSNSTLTSTSPSSSSNCVFVTEKKPRRKAASENFSVANSSTKNDLAGALISRIIKNDISKSEEVSRDSYNVPEENQDRRARRASCSQIIVTSSRKPHRQSVLQCAVSSSHGSTSSEQSLITDLSKTVAVSNDRVSNRKNGRTEPPNPVGEILSNIFANKVRVAESSGGAKSARDRYMSSSSPSFIHDQSIDEELEEDMEIFVNRAREPDEPEKTSVAPKGGPRSTFGNSNNNIRSVMNSFLEETMLKKMGSTMGDLDESNFY